MKQTEDCPHRDDACRNCGREAQPSVLELQPPAQPHRCVAVECPIRLADGAYLEVVRPLQYDRERGLD